MEHCVRVSEMNRRGNKYRPTIQWVATGIAGSVASTDQSCRRCRAVKLQCMINNRNTPPAGKDNDAEIVGNNTCTWEQIAKTRHFLSQNNGRNTCPMYPRRVQTNTNKLHMPISQNEVKKQKYNKNIRSHVQQQKMPELFILILMPEKGDYKQLCS